MIQSSIDIPSTEGLGIQEQEQRGNTIITEDTTTASDPNTGTTNLPDGDVYLYVSNVPTWLIPDRAVKLIQEKLGWLDVKCHPLWRPTQRNLRYLTYKVRVPARLMSPILSGDVFPTGSSIRVFRNGTNSQDKCPLRVLYMNVSGMRTKLTEFYAAISSTDYDVIILTETWLLPHIPDTMLAPDDEWTIFRRDRHGQDSLDRRGGGVLIAARNSLSPTLVSPTTNTTEQIWVKVKLPSKSMTLGVAYLPPSSDDTTRNVFCDEIDEVLNALPISDEALLYGDFNLPGIKWVPDDDHLNVFQPLEVPSIYNELISRLSSHGLMQLHGRKNNFGNVLDLVFSTCNDDLTIFHPTSALCQGFENTRYHSSIETILAGHFISRDSLDSPQPDYDFRRTDYELLNMLLSNVDWQDMLSNFDVDDAVAEFYSTVWEAIDSTTPKRPKQSPISRPWLNRELRKLRNRKRSAARKAASSFDCVDYSVYDELNKLFTDKNDAAYKEYLNYTAESLRDDPKRFWKHIDRKRNIHSIPETMFLDGTTVTGNDRVELLSAYFGQTYSLGNEYDALNPSFTPRLTTDIGSIPLTDVPTVSRMLRNLDGSKGAGPDGLPPILLKATAGNIATPLNIIFNKSLQASYFPLVWRTANVTPLFKSGSRSDVRNYRSISILSCPAKLLESYVTDYLSAEMRHILSNQQHAYLTGRSTTTNLTHFVSSVLKSIEIGKQVDAVYTDFSKAFDLIPHEALLHKLNLYGVGDSVTRWISSYLSERSQSVRVGSVFSSPRPVPTGVPQGSHLGPLLFALYVNDLIDTVESLGVSCSVYADDAKIYLPISGPTDQAKLQTAVNAVDEWCIRNGMLLNPGKCVTITYSRARNKLLGQYVARGTIIQRVDLVKDLGVWLDATLTMNQHIEKTIAKTRRVIGLIKRFCAELGNNVHIARILYLSLARPLMEYASVVWSPHCVTKMAQLESVQKQFVLWALRERHPINIYPRPPYRQRIAELRIDSISNRHKLSSILLAYDCIHGGIACPSIVSAFTINNTSRSTRGQPFFRTEQHRTDYGKYNPINRAMLFFNNVADLFGNNRSRGGFRKAVISRLRGDH